MDFMDWKQDLELLGELLMLKLEADRKKLHEMLDGRSIRKLSDEERMFAIDVLSRVVRLKRLEDLTDTEIVAILVELTYTLAEEFRIKPETTKDWWRQLFSIIEIERLKGQSMVEIIDNRLWWMPIWDNMRDWLMPEAFAQQIYENLKRASGE